MDRQYQYLLDALGVEQLDASTHAKVCEWLGRQPPDRIARLIRNTVNPKASHDAILRQHPGGRE